MNRCQSMYVAMCFSKVVACAYTRVITVRNVAVKYQSQELVYKPLLLVVALPTSNLHVITFPHRSFRQQLNKPEQHLKIIEDNLYW